MLDSDWIGLARLLGIGDRDVLRIQLDHANSVDQAAASLRLWACTADRPDASELERGLLHLGRHDIVNRFFYGVTVAEEVMPVAAEGL